MNAEQIAAAVVHVVDVRPGDVLVVCPPAGDVWSVEQMVGLRRHLEEQAPGVAFMVMRANAQFAALRKTDAETSWQADAGQFDRAFMTQSEVKAFLRDARPDDGASGAAAS